MKQWIKRTEVQAQTWKQTISWNMRTWFTKKREGNEQLIVALVMIAIAVALVLIFKDKISTLLGDFMDEVTTKINTALGVTVS